MFAKPQIFKYPALWSSLIHTSPGGKMCNEDRPWRVASVSAPRDRNIVASSKAQISPESSSLEI